jgi:ABC-type lipoprotein release transport system permease subunit
MMKHLCIAFLAACNAKQPAPEKHETPAPAANDPWKPSFGSAAATAKQLEREREATVGLNGDVLVLKEADNFSDYRAVLAAIEHTPCVVTALPMMVAWARIGSSWWPRRIRIRGVDPKRIDEIRALDHHIVAGSLSAFAAPAPAILIGDELAVRLGVQVGDDVSVAATFDGGRHEFRLAGTFHFDSSSVDDGLAIVGMTELQRLVGNGESFFTIGVWVNPTAQCSDVRDLIASTLGGDPYWVADTRELATNPLKAAFQAVW